MFTRKQFIVVQYVSKTNGKSDKLPVDYQSKRVINPLDPQYWTTREVAEVTARALGEGYGIGFVFTEADGYFFYDIDDCVMDGQWSPVALDAMRLFPEAYLEVSHSGRGLHIIGHYETIGKHKCRSVGGELYHSHRFVALTGTQARGNPDVDCTGALAALIEQYFKPDITTPAPVGLSSTELPDDEIISRMLASKPSAAAAFGSKATLQQLWAHDLDALSIAFPASDRPDGWTYDRSAADASLAQHLAFWTNNNQSQMQRLMQRSGLARDKYDRGDYLPRTTEGACAKQIKGYSPSGVRPLNISTGRVDKTQENVHDNTPTARTGSAFLDGDAQARFFEGCVYVMDENKILVPGGHLLNQSTFNAKLGGPQFVLTQENSKTTNKAWDAFTLSSIMRFPKVDSTCFKPNLKPATIIKTEGQTFANIFWPVEIYRKPGDVTLFLEHIAKLWPNPEDQRYILGYLAALVQFQGHKFSWCPIIQGVQGIGKTFISEVLTYTIGKRYCHEPKAHDITGKFNSWIYGRILITIEDFHISGSVMETMEILKPMITGKRLEIESKGVDKITKEICANFIINTNHRTSLRITKDDRRYAVFFTAQQEPEDVLRDGMDTNYFDRLFNSDYAAIADFLFTYKIEDQYNPLKMARAPQTSTTSQAIFESRSNLEYSIQEAIDSGEQGFRGGWISSTMFNRWLKANDFKLPLCRFHVVLKQLGYEPHPNMVRNTSRVVTPDGVQSKLYIRTGHPGAGLVNPAEIASAYEDAQKHTPPPV